MSYERTNWVNGETPINADNLNNMEEGIFNAHENLANYVPLAGAKELTGNLYGPGFYPNAQDSGILGGQSRTWSISVSNNFALYKGGKAYGNLQVGTEGTESTVGYTMLQLGNNIASGNAGNSTGFLWMYGKGTGSVQMHPHGAIPDGTVTQIYLPKDSGTLALASDVDALKTKTSLTATTNSEYVTSGSITGTQYLDHVIFSISNLRIGDVEIPAETWVTLGNVTYLDGIVTMPTMLLCSTGSGVTYVDGIVRVSNLGGLQFYCRQGVSSALMLSGSAYLPIA